MSYDISLCCPCCLETLKADDNHEITGGTYALGGTNELWLNVTYNYSQHYYRTMGEKGIRTIYGMTGKDSIPILEKAIADLGDEIDDDYWKPTEGNAKKALVGLLTFAKLKPEGVWRGD